jgi:hypothetical protein
MLKRSFSYLCFALLLGIAIISISHNFGNPTLLPGRFEKASILAAATVNSCFSESVHQAFPQSSTAHADATTLQLNLPSNPLIHDGYAYSYLISYPSRSAEVIRSGGLAGTSESLGTVHLGSCIRQAMLNYPNTKTSAAGQGASFAFQ